MGKAPQPALTKISALMSAEQLEVREAAALSLGCLELDANAVRPALAKALRDSKTEVRRAAMKSIQRFGPQGAIFVPDIIMMATRPGIGDDRGQRAGRTDPRAGRSEKEAIPALDRMREDPNAAVCKQAQAASDRIKSKAESSQDNVNARKTAST